MKPKRLGNIRCPAIALMLVLSGIMAAMPVARAEEENAGILNVAENETIDVAVALYTMDFDIETFHGWATDWNGLHWGWHWKFKVDVGGLMPAGTVVYGIQGPGIGGESTYSYPIDHNTLVPQSHSSDYYSPWYWAGDYSGSAYGWAKVCLPGTITPIMAYDSDYESW